MQAMLSRSARFDTPRPPARPGALQSIYDAAATGWQDGIAKLGFLDAYASLMQAVPLQTQAAQVLDIGCGTGAFAQAWIDAHGMPASLTLTDISPPMLAIAAARIPGAETHVRPIGPELASLPRQDVILCAHVIEHLQTPEAALTQLFEQLKPGGLLILALSRPHWCTALVRWRWGNAAYTPDAATTMLRAAGFADITLHPFASGPPSRVSHGYIARRDC